MLNLKAEDYISQIQGEKATDTDLNRYSCPICKDTGWEIYVDENKCEVSRPCRCGLRNKRMLGNRLEFASIPKEFQNQLLNNFRTDVYGKESRNMAHNLVGFQRFVDEFDSMTMGFYFYSSCKGSGKTRMAATLGNELVARHHCVKFTTTLGLLDEIKRSWESKTEWKLLDDLKRTEVLILDDIGTEGGKDWIAEKFFSILNDRITSRKITIFTSNYEISRLPLVDRVKSRINKMVIPIGFPEQCIRNMVAEEERMEQARLLFRKE